MNQKELKVFNAQFVVRKKLSSGSFGVVFQGEDKQSGDQIALKIEKQENQEPGSLNRESHLLSRLQGIIGIPKLYWTGSEGAYNVMVIQLLGRDLAYYLKNLKKFSLKTVLQLAEQLLIILQQCHNRSVIHRDLKPENVLMSLNASELFLVDWGISKIYKERGQHIPFKEGKPFIGTTRYASISAHKGVELSRLDDLESLGYMLVFLYKGILPWQNLQNVSDKDKTKVVGRMKMSMEFGEICKDMPEQFIQYFTYVRKLQFKEQPDYELLINMFKQCAADNQIQMDGKYDWNTTTSNSTLSDVKKIAQVPQKASEKQFKKKSPSVDKRGSLVIQELQSSSGQQSSQFDFLKLPDQKGKKASDRIKVRHQSVSSLAPSQYSQVNTFQSSVANQYQSSVMDVVQFEQPSPKVEPKAIVPVYGFQEVRAESAGFIEDEEEGPSAQYQTLKQCQVNASFKNNLTDRRRR